MDMTGNTILVTGGTSGIGRALAEAFYKGGNTVIIAGRRTELLANVAASNPGMATAEFDIDDATGIAGFAARIVAEHPALNVLINNAGIMRTEDLLAEDYAMDDAEAMIATNFLGPIRLTTALLPHLRAQAKAAVLNVSSGLAFVPLSHTPTYSATKAALHSWSQSLRHQLRATPVEVIELAPPAVATDLMPNWRENPHAMQLDDYIAQTMALLDENPRAAEICVPPVRRLRDAERRGNYDAIFAMLNPVI